MNFFRISIYFMILYYYSLAIFSSTLMCSSLDKIKLLMKISKEILKNPNNYWVWIIGKKKLKKHTSLWCGLWSSFSTVIIQNTFILNYFAYALQNYMKIIFLFHSLQYGLLRTFIMCAQNGSAGISIIVSKQNSS